VLAAIRDVRRRHPDASLTIVGDRPADLAAHDGVVAAGFLHKEDPGEVARFRDILASAMALVLPTRGDVSPLIIAEAGYFGCPAIASRSFGIPELVLDGATGILLDDPRDAGAVARAMTWMIEHENEYRRMRKGAWDRSRSEYSRPQFEKRVVGFVNRVMQPMTTLKG
jgi:glycosyltransferase involved in cell wall biosynthesis